jgi:hypothetical protein
MSGLVVESFANIAPDGLPDRCVSVSSNDPRILLSVHRPEVHLAIWHRDLPNTLSGRDLRPLMAAAPFTAIANAPPAALTDRLAEVLPAPAPTDLLLDIADLALAFTMLDGHRGAVRVRLEALIHNGCSRWHADAIGLRLLCTYRGPGTEYLPLDGGAAAARELPIGAPHRSMGRIATGAVAILKGEAHPGAAGRACIHRSPSAGPGQRARLLLCIDQPEWNLDE